MHIVEVIPLGKGVTPDSLSYFSPTPYARGTLIQVPVRKRMVPAIVVGISDAFSMKAALRAATFSLRRLPPQKDQGGISPAYFETAEVAARYHGTNINTTLYALLPKEIREGTIPLVSASAPDTIPPIPAKPRLLVAPTRERYQEYSRLVRESFAAKHSIIFVLPTIEHLTQFVTLLSPGIEDYTLTLHGDLPLGTLRKHYARLTNEGHPLLIITTPSNALIERSDIGTMILEHERSQGYHQKTRPYLDYRVVLHAYCARRGISLTLADTLPRTEEVVAYGTDSFGDAEYPKRLELKGSLSMITLVHDKDSATPFSLLSPELEKALKDAQKQKKRVFLFSARRGLAPLVGCIDCGEILRDPESGAPLSLSRVMRNGVEERWLMSSVSGYRTPAFDLCPKCGSWRLRERGIGIQQVYDECKRRFPETPITLFDHQTASTHKKATALKDQFYKNPGGILIGTALALPYLERPVDTSAIVSMDALRALPSWRQQEEILSILLTLREKTLGTVHVQTRVEDEVFEFARRGAIADFYAEEMKVREQFQYPPYSTFVHIAWKEKTRGQSETKKLLETLFAPHQISLYSALEGQEASGSESIHYGLMRIPAHDWPDETILQKLRSLSPALRITINPDRII